MDLNFSDIRMLVCDFDGVMTNNKVILDENGKESVVCNRGDGLGIDLIKKKGVEVFIISKEKNKVVESRCKKLQINFLQGIDNKIGLFKEEINKRGLLTEKVCYIGNDVNDIECIEEAGIGVAVADSNPKVLEIANFITKKKGGDGAVREVCDLILGSSKAM
jgi:YrbI family 3-deoxy-D-manno-octulosonate 8-phosphate phosphatase